MLDNDCESERLGEKDIVNNVGPKPLPKLGIFVE